MQRFMLASAFFVCFASRLLGEDVSVPVTISEPVGQARKAESACGGIPFKPGQVKEVAELVLLDSDGKAVPAQFSKMAGYEDGSAQWALLDVIVPELPAKGKVVYTVRAGKAVAPAKPLDIKDEADKIVVDAGAAVFTINKGEFNLLESVAVGGAAVAGPGGLVLTDAEGAVYKAAKPTNVSWEYRGPVRATLRVDGPFTNAAGEEYTCYTTRLTFWAGSGAVRVVQSLRNSHPTNGFDARLKSATVRLNLAGLAEKAKANDYVAFGGDKAGLLVTDRHTAGCYPAGPTGTESESVTSATRVNLHQLAASADAVTVYVVPEATPQNARMIGYGVTSQPDAPATASAKPKPMKRPFVPTGPHASRPGLPHFAIADLAHVDSEIWFDFGAAGLDADALKARRDGLHSQLHALADGAWIAQTSALGPGRFGTLADEIATYRKWGWKGFDDPKKQAPASSPARPDAFISHVDIHDESESDAPELFTLMYARTGERGFLDQAAAYAGYYKGHAVWRTDGFVYDGFRHERSGVIAKSKRKSTGLGHGWYGPAEYGWSDGRFHMCHQWATGLIDYYCLTGDVDALEGGLDWAEYAAATYFDQKPGGAHGWGRAWGRSFGIITRAWQVTRDPKWKQLADTYAQIAVKAPNRQEDGLYVVPTSSMVDYFVRDNIQPRNDKDPGVPARLKAYVEEKGITWKVDKGNLVLTDKAGKSWKLLSIAQGFEYQACCESVARYGDLTGSAEAKKLTVDLANVARKYCWSEKCQFAISHPYIGYPDEGKLFDRAVWEDSHNACPASPGGAHSGYHSRFLVDIFARAYAGDGNQEWLDWAKKCWNRGSKRGYYTPSQSAADDEVGSFAEHGAPKGDGIDIRHCKILFYEVAHQK